MFISTLLVAFLSLSLAGADCSHDNCLRAFIREGADVTAYCETYTAGLAIPSFAANCNGDVVRVASACSCIYTAPPVTSTSTTLITSKITKILFSSLTHYSGNFVISTRVKFNTNFNLNVNPK